MPKIIKLFPYNANPALDSGGKDYGVSRVGSGQWAACEKAAKTASHETSMKAPPCLCELV